MPGQFSSLALGASVESLRFELVGKPQWQEVEGRGGQAGSKGHWGSAREKKIFLIHHQGTR